MGEVYRATDTRLGREVAIKVLPANIGENPQMLVRFEREAKALAALNHPHIAGIHGFEADRGTHFLILELVPGETLNERLRRGPVPVAEALKLARQMAEAIQEAHEKGIIHRDIKPGNVKITPQGRVKVLDFGLAKILHPQIDESAATRSGDARSELPTLATEITGAGAVMGTPAYMSPEQALGQEVDKRTDVWAFGCCLYECLSGRKAFHGESLRELMTEVLNSEPDWRELPDETPREVAILLRGCLEKEPARRLSSMGDIAIILEEASRGVSTGLLPGDRSPQNLSTRNVRPSVAVLPFVNMSADKENEYFSDGITEDLITALSKIEGLRVPARTSSFAFKHKRDDIRRIGQELRVNMLLDGSVRRAGNRLRITAQLIDVGDGFHLWSERYDRDLQDVFDIQEEITGQVVGALTLKLGLAEKRSITRKATSNLEAYDLYLLGRHLWAKREDQDLPKVLDLFQRALEKDPHYALAYSGLADYYIYQGYFFGRLPFVEATNQAREYALKAITLDPELGEAHVSLGLVKAWLDWDFAGAAAELKRAVELNPNYPTAYHFGGMQLWAWRQRLEEALAFADRGLNLDPLSLPLRNMRAIILSQAGRHDLVIAETKGILEINPHYVWEYLGRAYENTGHPEQAVHWYLRWLEEDGAKPEVVAEMRNAAETDGIAGFHRRMSELLVEGIEVLPLARHWQQAYRIQAFARLGRIDDAFRLLDQTHLEKSPLMMWLKVDLRLERLRDDPRFRALLRKFDLKIRLEASNYPAVGSLCGKTG